MMLLSPSGLARSLRVGGGAASSSTSVRSLSISTPSRAPPLQQQFRAVANTKDRTEFERVKERLREVKTAGKLTPQVSIATWQVVIDRWPIHQAIAVLSDDQYRTLLLPPLQTVQPMRDLARRLLSDGIVRYLDSIRSLQTLLERYAPDDPFTLLLLLSSYHAIPPQKDSAELQRAIQIVSDKILRCIRAEGKWAFFTGEEHESNAGDEDWGMKREVVMRRLGEDGALAFGIVEAKVTLNILDGLIEKAKDGLVPLELLGWYATQPVPASVRFHRTRLQNYLQPLNNLTSTDTVPSSLSLPLLNIFLYPALLQQGSDPLVNIFALQALLLVASSPSTSTLEQEAAQDAMKTLLLKIEKVTDSWTSDEHRELLQLAKTEGKRVRETFGIQCLKNVQGSGLMLEDQKDMWDKVFEQKAMVDEEKESTEAPEKTVAKWEKQRQEKRNVPA